MSEKQLTKEEISHLFRLKAAEFAVKIHGNNMFNDWLSKTNNTTIEQAFLCGLSSGVLMGLEAADESVRLMESDGT